MCYNIRYLTKKKLDYARRFGDNEAEIKRLEEELKRLGERVGPTYYITGFDHPEVPIITNEHPKKFTLSEWGLVPAFVRDVKYAVELSNKTLNARGEEMFEKSSFKDAARQRRCLVVIDGFYEYHWKNNNSFPHHIVMKNGDPMVLGGLWEFWDNIDGLEKHTFSIVTAGANRTMSHIHNRPAGSDEPRMPLIIPKDLQDEWLKPADDELDVKQIKEYVQAYDDSELDAFPVARLKGKNGVGNSKEAVEKKYYPELEESQGELF